MIQLTHFNNQPFMLNPFLIEQVESLPDTTITLTNGKKLIVRESPEEVSRIMMVFLKQISLVSGLSAEEGVRKCSKAEE
ncbi:flagellar FlbD family protein [Sporolactobacillus shoreicorticis]|nr:flagellar FlbD family protein [Sporolactobacillus shoreicorticis]MCO7125990.1 flagellar FlbD family protein [Sporolactobacillus shoreicorticis]